MYPTVFTMFALRIYIYACVQQKWLRQEFQISKVNFVDLNWIRFRPRPFIDFKTLFQEFFFFRRYQEFQAFQAFSRVCRRFKSLVFNRFDLRLIAPANFTALIQTKFVSIHFYHHIKFSSFKLLTRELLQYSPDMSYQHNILALALTIFTLFAFTLSFPAPSPQPGPIGYHAITDLHKKIDRFLKNNEIALVSATYCPYAEEVKARLDEISADYSVFEVDDQKASDGTVRSKTLLRPKFGNF